MKTYEEFKYALLDRIKDYLPEEFRDCEMEVSDVVKVNEKIDSLTIIPRDDNVAIPSIYFEDYYKRYMELKDLEVVIQEAANFYVEGLRKGGKITEHLDVDNFKECVVIELINKDNNKTLLSTCPNRDFLDLAVIYRWMIALPDGSFNSAIVTDRMMNGELRCDEEELYRLAFENTKRLLPPVIEKIEENFNVITNSKFTHGATAMIYDEYLAQVAENMKSDLYILPSSIHEVIAIPVLLRDVKSLTEMVKDANQTVIDKRDMLSNNVYIYEYTEKKLRVATP